MDYYNLNEMKSVWSFCSSVFSTVSKMTPLWNLILKDKLILFVCAVDLPRCPKTKTHLPDTLLHFKTLGRDIFDKCCPKCSESPFVCAVQRSEVNQSTAHMWDFWCNYDNSKHLEHFFNLSVWNEETCHLVESLRSTAQTNNLFQVADTCMSENWDNVQVILMQVKTAFESI